MTLAGVPRIGDLYADHSIRGIAARFGVSYGTAVGAEVDHG